MHTQDLQACIRLQRNVSVRKAATLLVLQENSKDLLISSHSLVKPGLKGIRQLFVFLLFASLPSSRQEDRSHSFDCACSNKEESGRAHPLLIQILVVNGKC